jgi:hypothetical protein
MPESTLRGSKASTQIRRHVSATRLGRIRARHLFDVMKEYGNMALLLSI